MEHNIRIRDERRTNAHPSPRTVEIYQEMLSFYWSEIKPTISFESINYKCKLVSRRTHVISAKHTINSSFSFSFSLQSPIELHSVRNQYGFFMICGSGISSYLNPTIAADSVPLSRGFCVPKCMCTTHTVVYQIK